MSRPKPPVRAGSAVARPERAQTVGLTTLPALMQDVQAMMRLVLPFTTARTRWMLGFPRRGVRRCEWETRMPNPGPLPQTSQTEATGNSKWCRCSDRSAARMRPTGGPGITGARWMTPRTRRTDQRSRQCAGYANRPAVRPASAAAPRTVGKRAGRRKGRVVGEVLDEEAVRRWCRLSAEALGRARAEIDALNVFPVHDGDTGTNLHLTALAAAD